MPHGNGQRKKTINRNIALRLREFDSDGAVDGCWPYSRPGAVKQALAMALEESRTVPTQRSLRARQSRGLLPHG